MTVRDARLRERLPCVMLVADAGRAAPDELCRVVAEAASGGVQIVQLRAKQLATSGVIALGRRVQQAVGGRALLVINTDIEAAIALGADGVHFPEDVPRGAGVPDGMIVSRSVHSVDAAQRAASSGADLVVAGTVFPSASHPGGATIGLEGLRAICEAVSVPVMGIGGITPANASDVMRAGAAGVAVIGAVFDAPDARMAAEELKAAIENVRARAPG